MAAKIDLSQNFLAIWNMPEPEANDAGYEPGSLEEYFWPKYKILFAGIYEHAMAGDVESLKWHKTCLRIITQKINEMITQADE